MLRPPALQPSVDPTPTSPRADYANAFTNRTATLPLSWFLLRTPLLPLTLLRAALLLLSALAL